MKRTSKLILFLIILLAGLFAPQTALAQGPSGDEFVFGGTYTLSEGDTLDGNLYVFGGIATLEEGSTIQGDVILAGGTLQASGEVTGNIIATGGLVNLDDTASVSGDITVLGAHLDRAPGAVVEGQVNSGIRWPFQFAFPRGIPFPYYSGGVDIVWETLWFLFRSFLWAAIAVLVVIFLARNVERTAAAAVAQPLISVGIGLLTAIVVPIMLVIIAITIIGIPVTLLGALLLVIAWGYGMISLGTEVGRRVARAFNQEWALPLEAGLGTFILVVVTNAIDKLIPCVGWLVPAFVGMLGLGAVLLTRFGTQTYPTTAALPPPPPATGWPPAEPEAPPPVVGPAEPPPAPPATDWTPAEPPESEYLPPEPAAPPEIIEEEDDRDQPQGGTQVFPSE